MLRNPNLESSLRSEARHCRGAASRRFFGAEIGSSEISGPGAFTRLELL